MKSIRINGLIGVEKSWDDSKIGETSASFHTLIDEAKKDNEDKKITIFLNSPGGSVFHGMNMYNEIIRARMEGFHTTTVNMGMCASMGSIILLAGDEVQSYEASTFMMHLPRTMAFGDENDLKREMKSLEVFKNVFGASVYSKRIKKDKSEIEKMMSDTTWLDSKQGKEMGIYDTVISGKKVEKIPQSQYAAQIFNDDMNKNMPLVAFDILQLRNEKHTIGTVDYTTMTKHQLQEQIWKKFINS